MNQDHEALKNFMAAYFHEDWPDCDGSSEEVVRHYFREQDSIDQLSSVLRALRELIEGDGDDEVLLSRLFREFGSYYNPLGGGLSTRAWLQSLADDFEREISVRRAE